MSQLTEIKKVCSEDFCFLFMAERHAIRHNYFILLRKSPVVHAHRARPRLPSCKRLRSKECPRCRTKWRYATAITKRVRGHRSLMFPMSPNGLIELFIQHYGFGTAFITLLMISLSVTSSSGVQVSHISFPSK